MNPLEKLVRERVVFLNARFRDVSSFEPMEVTRTSPTQLEIVGHWQDMRFVEDTLHAAGINWTNTMRYETPTQRGGSVFILDIPEVTS